MEIFINHPVRCYIISIVLQTTGALLLIANVWGNTRQRVIDMYYASGVFAYKITKDKVILSCERVRSCVKSLYLNRIAFLDIAAGYFLAIFGEIKSISKVELAINVIVLSIILVFVQYKFAKWLAELRYDSDMEINPNEIPTDIETIPTKEEVEEMIDQIVDNCSLGDE